ncbi:malonate transporter subunit MadM, partial [Klebsiella pneumoniae]
MEQLTKILTSNFTSNALITAFVVVGIVCWVAAWISTHVFRGKIHSSAIAIAAGLLLSRHDGDHPVGRKRL